MPLDVQAALSVLSAALETNDSARRRVGLSSAGWDLAVREGRAPTPVKLGRDRYFVRAEVDAWLARRAAARVPAPDYAQP